METKVNYELIDKYMPRNGEGNSKASQVCTAFNKLDYKWWNDGDTYSNQYHLQGWANDLSSYANWLYKHTTWEAGNILNMIEEARNGNDYAQILQELHDELIDPIKLEKWDKEPVVSSIYDEYGPFEFVDHEEDDEDDHYGYLDDPEDDFWAEEDDEETLFPRESTVTEASEIDMSLTDDELMIAELHDWMGNNYKQILEELQGDNVDIDKLINKYYNKYKKEVVVDGTKDDFFDMFDMTFSYVI